MPNDTQSNAASEWTALLDATVDAIIVIDRQGNIETFNSAAEAMFGFEAHEVIGKNVSALMPEPFHSQHDGYIRNYLETRERPAFCLVFSDHGTAYGEDGYEGHRLAHPTVWDVPYAQFVIGDA